ncbi:hypothetical protein [Novosphingobium sp.]|uniref:hypothetical protein n=1 Tax=Novosphingobium sp. TaxID=1874826 RepID=UPI00286DEC68|nr:hypothetical protein [Novosphingobium sp.]
MSELPITPGQTERFTATFTNDDGTAIDLTNSTVSLKSDGAAIAAIVTVTNAIGGAVSVLIDTDTTSAITRRERVRFKRVVSGGDTYLEEWFWLAPR